MTSALVFTPTSLLSHPYQHLSQQRTRDFPKEPLSVRGLKNSLGEGTRLFCDACAGELSLVKSSIEDHCRRAKHKTNVAMMAHTKKEVVRIEESMNEMHKQVALSCSFGLDLTHLSRHPLRVSLFLATHKRFDCKPLLHCWKKVSPSRPWKDPTRRSPDCVCYWKCRDLSLPVQGRWLI
jgi:hypothetical protein